MRSENNRKGIKGIISLALTFVLIFANIITVFASDEISDAANGSEKNINAAYATDYSDEEFEAEWAGVIANIYITDDGRYYYFYNPITEYIALVEDDADRLTDEEEYWLLFSMSSITDFGNVYYKSIYENSFYDASDYAEDYLNNQKGCYGGGSGTVLLDDTVNRRLEIFSNGEINRYITKGKAVSITDNIYQYATNGRYYDCAEEAFYEISTLLHGGKIAEPMKYLNNFFLAIIISLILCFIVALITSSTTKASVSEVIKAAYKRLRFTDVQKIFQGETRVYDPPSSSSDSDSGGGGGSGGGHSY